MKEKLLVIGIDPGVTRTGVVLKHKKGGKPVAFATFASPGTMYAGMPYYNRVTQLADWMSSWCWEHVKGTLKICVCIESPVYTGNARAFELQWRLFQQIICTMSSDWGVDMVLEVNPKTAKKVMTGNGNANKLDMVLASHFDGQGFKQEDAEALADAEAVAECYFSQVCLDGNYDPYDTTPACTRSPIVSSEGEDIE